MALLGYWGMGSGQVPEVCTVSDTPIIFNDEDDGLPAYCPYGMYPPTNDTIWFDIPDRDSTSESIFVGFWGRMTGNATTAYPFSLQLAGINSYLQLRGNNSTEEIRVVYSASLFGGSQVLMGSAFTPAGFDWNDWNFFELEWLPSTTSGTVRLRINGETPTGWSDQTGVQTAVSTSANAGVNFWQRNGATWLPITSGIYALDSSGSELTTFLGVCRFPFLQADGSGESDWLGSDADSVDNHLMVDDAPGAVMNLTDYVESDTTTDRQVVTVESLSGLGLDAAGAPIAATAMVFAVDTGAGGAAIDVGLRSNGTDDVSAVTLDTANELRSHMTQTDPDTAANWTEAGIDALEVLVEVG